MTSDILEEQKNKPSPNWNSSCYYERELEIIWKENHPPDVPEVNTGWRSWQK